MNSMTTTRYLNLLETSFLISRMPPFMRNRSSRLVKSPKLFFTDSGLAAHLASVASLESDEDDRMRGPLFETFMRQNLAAILGAHVPDARLCYWNEQGRQEVDFVVENGRSNYAIQVKAASQWS